MDVFNSKIKPNLTNYTNEELLSIIEELKTDDTITIDNFNRDDAVKIIYNYWKTYRLDEDLKCPICFELITNSNLTITECDHYFHSNCIFISLIKNDNCPICRHQLVDRNIVQEIDNSNIQDNLSEDSSINSIFNIGFEQNNVIIISSSNMHDNSDNDSVLSINTI
jgi:hypothetical protein